MAALLRSVTFTWCLLTPRWKCRICCSVRDRNLSRVNWRHHFRNMGSLLILHSISSCFYPINNTYDVWSKNQNLFYFSISKGNKNTRPQKLFNSSMPKQWNLFIYLQSNLQSNQIFPFKFIFIFSFIWCCLRLVSVVVLDCRRSPWASVKRHYYSPFGVRTE